MYSVPGACVMMRNVLGSLESVLNRYLYRIIYLAAALAAAYYCTMIPLSHQAFRHSEASIRSSLMEQRWGLRSFLVLLNTLSHSVDIVGIERVSKNI